ncbi:hypothetical protein WJX82_011576 [Trebouxia sp. C0006]
MKRHTAVSCPAVLDMAAYTSTGTFSASSTLYNAVAYVSHEGHSPISVRIKKHVCCVENAEASLAGWARSTRADSSAYVVAALARFMRAGSVLC